MPDPKVQAAQDWLRAHEQELLEDTLKVLRIPSIESEAKPGAPFGEANRQALDFVLDLGKRWGMRTTDLDGYCGYAEFGQGDRLVVVLGHLDVVPTGPGWKHEPFGAEIDDGYIYARGSTDDKGPTMAAFYAARAIQETVPDIPARIRVVFGCDEESGMQCVARYAKTEEIPTFGIAPDAGWPLYHAEKGIANLHVSVDLPKGKITLLEASGGQRPNIVIDHAVGKIRVAPEARSHVDAKLADNWDRNVTFSWDGDVLSAEAIGKAAHGSHPYSGDSAAIRLFRFFLSLVPAEEAEWWEQVFGAMHISGVGLGIHGRDEVSKDLTTNIGVLSVEGGRLKMLANVRYPVTWKGSHLRSLCEDHLKTLGPSWRLDDFEDSPSLYFPLDHPLVTAICEVYKEESGEDRKPGVMGGGTYARKLPNTVAIGTGWTGDGNAHETDERLKVDHLYRMSRIYAHILHRLATMPGGS